MYLLMEQELRDLVEGKIKVEDLITPEKVALITWSGEDIKIMIEQKKLKFDLDDAVRIVKKAVEWCDCAMCVKCAFDCVEDKIKETSPTRKG